MDKQTRETVARMWRVAALAAVRGAGTAVGGCLVTGVVWWLQNR